ncbi:MAG: sensor of ECF-type sigma factor [Flavobacterium sp.]|nr:sensor of ECF-type sigma factor [Flavobacterium sp.]
MKTAKLLSTLAFLFTIVAISQPRLNQKREQVKALKIAYITDELKLTPEEATKFWPLFNAYEEKQKSFRKERIRSFMDQSGTSNIDKMTEKEAASILNDIENSEEDAYQNRKKFVASLKPILPATKILKLKKAEEGFNKKLLKQFRDKTGKE